MNISKNELKKALRGAYEELDPYSKKYRADFDRYLYSLGLIAQIPDIEKKRVLDIGTGAGIIPLALKKIGINASGLDYYIFPENKNDMFAFPEMQNLQAVWKKNDIEVYNQNIFEKESLKKLTNVDVVISEAMIEHLKDPKEFLDACHLLLSEGGYMLLTSPNIATLLKRIRFLFGKSPLWPVLDFYNEGERFTGHWREYTARELMLVCEKSNFTVLDIRNKNTLTKFKKLPQIRKNIRATVTLFSNLVPGSRDMHYLLCKKK